MSQLNLWLSKGQAHNVASLLTFLTTHATSAAAPAHIYLCLEASTPRSVFLEQAQHLYNAALEHTPDAAVNVIPVHGLSESATEHHRAAGQAELVTRSWMTTSPGFQPCYRYVAVGGTFDHLHSGHKLLLSTAILYAVDKLRVGITGDQLLQKKKFREQLEPIDVRVRHVRAFLQELRSDVELEIDEISDVSGGTDVIPDVQALIVSPETEASLPIINDLRDKNGFAPLIPVRIPYVETSAGTHISSTLLRQRLADGNSNTNPPPSGS